MRKVQLLLLVALAGLVASQEVTEVWIGRTDTADASHPVSGNGAYLGVAYSADATEFNPMLQIQFTEGNNYTVHIAANASTSVYFTTGSGNGSPVGSLIVTGGTNGAGAHVGDPGDTLNVYVPLGTEEVLFYQSFSVDDMGWYVIAKACSTIPPSAPVLSWPIYGGSMRVDERVQWEPVDFGVGCAAGSNYYKVLLNQGGSVLDADNDVVQGTASLVWRSTSYPLRQAAITPGFDGYWWAVVACNSDVCTMSDNSTFDSTDEVVTVPYPLTNAAPIQQRMYPDIPVSSGGDLFYSIDIDSPGGVLTIISATSTLSVPNAPSPGSVQLYVAPENSTGVTNDRPTSSDYVWMSEESTSIKRKTVTIPNADADTYYVGVYSPTGLSTFALTAVYYCPEDSYLTDPAGTACTKCPKNSVAAFPGITKKSDCVCKEGYFGSKCDPCPTGGICDGSGTPAAQAGFWAYDGDQGSVFYKCPNPNACVGGPASKKKSCAEGYSGRLCSRCDKGYYKLGGQCFSCPKAAGFNFAAGVILLIVFLAVSPELARFYRKICSFSITIAFFQTCAIMPYFSLDWPQYLVVFFNDMSGFNLNTQLIAPECVAEMRWQTQWQFTILFPLMVLGFLALVFFIAAAGSMLTAYIGMGALRLERILDTFAPAYITFLLFVYVPVARASLGFFDCTAQPDKSATLDDAANILCYDTEWNRLLPLGILALFLYAICIPLVLLVWLFYKHHQLYSVDESDNWVYMWLGPVYLRYTSKYYWWEIVNLVRKLLLIIVGSFFTTFPAFQGVLAVGILTTALYLQTTLHPYEVPEANSLEAGLLFAQIMLFLIGMLFQSGSIPDQSGMPEFIFVVVFFLFLAVFISCVYVIGVELYHKHKAIDPETYRAMMKKIAALDSHVAEFNHSEDDDHQRDAPPLPAPTSDSDSDESDSDSEETT